MGPLVNEWLMYQLLGGDDDTLCVDCLPWWHDFQVERGMCAYPFTIFYVRLPEKGGGLFGLRRKKSSDKPNMSVLNDDSEGFAVSSDALAYIEKQMGRSLGGTVPMKWNGES